MERHLLKEVHDLVRCLYGLTDNQAKLIYHNEPMCDHLKFLLTPNSGLYAGGKFIFRVRIPPGYPAQCPDVRCETPIYHPNIDTLLDSGYVCVSTLNEWQAGWGLDDVVQALLFLLHNPAVDESLFPLITVDMDPAEFAGNVLRTLSGEEVEDVFWPLNMDVPEPPSVRDVRYATSPPDRPPPDVKTCVDIRRVEDVLGRR